MAVGIIVEYNPFHNGHLHHINETKKLFPDDEIIAVMSGQFVQRGEPAILDKWSRCDIALSHGVDIMIELPYIYATSHADLFAHGAVKILNEFGVRHIVFGSELNDVTLLYESAKIQLEHPSYDNLVKKYLDQGLNYPTSMSKALSELIGHHYDTPNDLLGLSYVKEIIKNNYRIEAHTIKRTNDYHGIDFKDVIASATSIRHSYKVNEEFKFQVPLETYNYMTTTKCIYKEDFFDYLIYKIRTTSIEDLSLIHGMDEGIEYKLKKESIRHHDYESFMKSIKSKRYTYNRVQRLLTNLLLNLTKDDAQKLFNIEYLRLLGFTKQGQLYLNKIKGKTMIPISSKFTEGSFQLDFELRASSIYALALEHKEANELIQKEIRSIPIRK